MRKPSSCVKVSLYEKCESRLEVDTLDPLWAYIAIRLFTKNETEMNATKMLRHEPHTVLNSGLPFE